MYAYPRRARILCSMTSSKASASPTDLIILRALSAAGGVQNWITAPAVARDSRAQGQELNAPTVYRVLSQLFDFVEYRTTDGVRRFHLKRVGQTLLGAGHPHGPTFVAPGTPWSTQRQLRDFLGTCAVGYLLIVDPYI